MREKERKKKRKKISAGCFDPPSLFFFEKKKQNVHLKKRLLSIFLLPNACPLSPRSGRGIEEASENRRRRIIAPLVAGRRSKGFVDVDIGDIGDMPLARSYPSDDAASIDERPMLAPFAFLSSPKALRVGRSRSRCSRPQAERRSRRGILRRDGRAGEGLIG